MDVTNRATHKRLLTDILNTDCILIVGQGILQGVHNFTLRDFKKQSLYKEQRPKHWKILHVMY